MKARILGPVSTGWFFYWNAARKGDRSKHGMGLIPWFLQQVHAYDQSTDAQRVPGYEIKSEGDTRILNAWLAYGRSYRIESSVDHTHWEQITILPGTDGLLRFPLPKDVAGESTATAYRITPL